MTTNDRLALIKDRLAVRSVLKTPWQPVSAIGKEHWKTWLWKTVEYPHLAPRDRRCPRCMKANPAGDVATAWLCDVCLGLFKDKDAEALLRNGQPMPAPYRPGAPSSRSLMLAVARKLPRPFTLAQLAVALWLDDPIRWGLAGFEEKYPDAHKARCALHGPSGLITLGLLVKVGTSTFEVVS